MNCVPRSIRPWGKNLKSYSQFALRELWDWPQVVSGEINGFYLLSWPRGKPRIYVEA